jgi:hypothetical protein
MLWLLQDIVAFVLPESGRRLGNPRCREGASVGLITTLR